MAGSTEKLEDGGLSHSLVWFPGQRLPAWWALCLPIWEMPLGGHQSQRETNPGLCFVLCLLTNCAAIF